MTRVALPGAVEIRAAGFGIAGDDVYRPARIAIGGFSDGASYALSLGIINADLALHLPDFRAGERTFQLLTQVAGRAGRGETSGEVFVQTYTPFSPSIQFARHHDFAGYFQQELEFRERCDFPPFKHAVLITVRSAHEGRAKLSAETLQRRLKEALPQEFILGDATPAPLEKLQGQFRFHILVRGEAIMRLSRLVRETVEKLPFPEDVTVTVDVDPYQLL